MSPERSPCYDLEARISTIRSSKNSPFDKLVSLSIPKFQSIWTIPFFFHFIIVAIAKATFEVCSTYPFRSFNFPWAFFANFLTITSYWLKSRDNTLNSAQLAMGIELQEMVFFQHHPTPLVRWLQGKVVHFLCHNQIFCRLACIYMLLTWHKNNNFPNLWLDLDCQLEIENIYKRKLQHIYIKYIIMDFLKLKNMDRSIVCAPIYMHFFVWILFEIYYRDSIYDMLKQ